MPAVPQPSMLNQTPNPASCQALSSPFRCKAEWSVPKKFTQRHSFNLKFQRLEVGDPRQTETFFIVFHLVITKTNK